MESENVKGTTLKVEQIEHLELSIEPLIGIQKTPSNEFTVGVYIKIKDCAFNDDSIVILVWNNLERIPLTQTLMNKVRERVELIIKEKSFSDEIKQAEEIVKGKIAKTYTWDAPKVKEVLDAKIKDWKVKLGILKPDEIKSEPKQPELPESNTLLNTASSQQVTKNSSGGSGGKSRNTTITKSGFELSAEGLSYFADKLMDEMKIKVIRGSKLKTIEVYIWKEGYYHIGADQDVNHLVKNELQELYDIKWFTIVYNHIVSKGSIETWQFKQPKRTINIANGILEYKNNKVVFKPREHPLDFHEMNFTYKLPVAYKPSATCPRISKIVEQILVDKKINEAHDINNLTWIQKLSVEELSDPEKQDEIQETLEAFRQSVLNADSRMSKVYIFYEFLGLCLMSEYEIMKSLALLGRNHVGKGTLVNIVKKFIGDKHISAVSLQNLSDSTYAPAELENCFVNIVEEMDSMSLKNCGKFKAATSGSIFRAEQKYADGHPFQNNSKFLLVGNECPRIPAKKFQTTIDRIVAIELVNNFDANDKTTDPKMQHQDYSEEELSGLLNLAIQGLERLLINNKFTGYDETETPTLWNKYSCDVISSEIGRFMAQHCNLTGNEDDKISREELYNVYKNIFKGKDNQSAFSKTVAAYKEDIVDNYGKVKGENTIKTCWHKKVRHWTGITFNESIKYLIPNASTIVEPVEHEEDFYLSTKY